MSENKVLFRVASFGGFNKDDVMQYIEEMEYKQKQLNEKRKLENKKLSDELLFFKNIVQTSGIDKENISQNLTIAKNSKNTIDELNLEITKLKSQLSAQSEKLNAKLAQKELGNNSAGNNSDNKDLVNEINSLKQQLASANIDKDDSQLAKENKILRGEINNIISKNKENEETIKKLCDEITTFKNNSSNKDSKALESELETLAKENEALIAQKQSLIDKNQELTDTTSKISEIKEALVKMELDAHIRANEICDKATLEASTIIENAETESKQILSNAQDDLQLILRTKTRLVNETRDSIASIVQSSNEKFKKVQEDIMNIHEINGTVLSTMNKFSDNITSVLNNCLEPCENKED